MKKFNVYNETGRNLRKEIKNIKDILYIAIKFEDVKNVYFNVIIVDNEYIRNINKTYRNIDRETDVISFALEDNEKENLANIRLLGDIYISIDKAISQSIEYGHSLSREISFLAVHGFLHLLGYDHIKKEDEKVMFSKQEMILSEKKFSRR